MQKVFGILMVMALLWAGIEYATKGDAAFGGLLGGTEVAPSKIALPGQLAGERLRRESDDRFERMERTISE